MKKQKKWLDNFGKADNANESNVSMSDDFVGLAYDTSGRNYSPAWKGQFQTGGTLPGSPGFMYARTVNPAPSEGKYAKKTMPSAQKGKEIQKQKYTESTLENIFEIFDPTGISSWNDVAASYMDTGMSDETKLEIFGALPLLGKVGKAGKYLSKVVKNQAIPSLLRATPYVGRGTDAVQAVQQYQSAPLLPSAPPAEVGQFGRYAGMGKMQNGGEMKFYQEGLDWKPKSMQDGGQQPLRVSTADPEYRKLYENRQVGSWSPEYQAYNLPDLPEVTVNPRTYSMESLRDFTKAAMYGVPENLMKLEQVPTAALTETVQMLRGEPYDFRNVNPNFGQFGSNQRDLSVLGYQNPEGFMQNAVNLGLSAIDPAMLTSIASPVVRGAIRTGVNLGDELATAQLRSIKNVGKDVSDKVRYVEDLRRMGLERSQDVPALENIDQIKGLRKFGQNLEEVYTDYVKRPFIESSKVNDFLKKANELRTESESLTSKGVLKQIDRKNIDAILSRADQLTKYNNEEFIDKFSKYMTPAMNQTFKENPELGENYMRSIQQMNMTDPDEIGMYINNTFNENFDELIFEKNYGSRTKSKDFDPDWRNVHNYKVADEPSLDRKSLYKDDSGKLFTEKTPSSASSKDASFYSTEFYKNLGDRLTNMYADFRLKNSPIIPELPSKGVYTAELIPSLFANRQDAKAIMFKASKYTDATDDMAFIPASSLSSDSYPMGLQMMQGSLKRNPGSKINFYGYSPMNDFGYATKLVSDPNLLRSELSGYVSDLEKVAGKTLPKPYINNYGEMIIPKFALSKGQATKDIDDYLKNTSIGQRLRLNSPVMNADFQPQVSDPRMANLYNLHNSLNANRNITIPPDFDTSIFSSSDMDIFKKGGVIKDNRGQWNHPGEITEIDSPYITMQGVPYDVLGVSDTGDTKLMEPGKDYKFNGSKVTEYPMAQKGINTPYEPVSSTIADIFRTVVPAPKNFSQMLAKEVLKDARMSNSSLSDDEKLVLWNTIQNARKRTGKDSGGTQYQDYGNQGWGTPEEFHERINRGKNSVTDLIVNSLENPAFNLATTIGRGMYRVDPTNPDVVHYTDNYDWNSSEKNFSGENEYQKLRNYVRNNEDKDVNEKMFDMKFTLTKDEIEKIKQKKDWTNTGPQFGRYAGMPVFNEKKKNGGSVGINQLDAQPKKKLNQLLNFTNNPDKDWLKKYQ